MKVEFSGRIKSTFPKKDNNGFYRPSNLSPLSQDCFEKSAATNPLNGARKLDVMQDLGFIETTPKTTPKQLKNSVFNSLATQRIQFLKENKDLTLENMDNLYPLDPKKPFDAPARFYIASHNSYANKGNAFVCDKTPEVFKGIEQSKIQKALDNFTVLIRNNDDICEFEIDGKKFISKYINGGRWGEVYKIADTNGNSAALKIFKQQNMICCHGSFSEIPILRQMAKDNVKDVPEFFMANPIPRKFKNYKMYSSWMLSEFIDDNTKVRKTGQTMLEWLEAHELSHTDRYHARNSVNGFCVDLGGITKRNCNLIEENFELGDLAPHFKARKNLSKILSEAKLDDNLFRKAISTFKKLI